MKYMRKNLFCCGLCLFAVSVVSYGDESDYSRDRYQPIVERSPFGKEDVGPTAVDLQTAQTLQTLEKNVRLNFLLKSETDGEIRAGFQNLKPAEGEAKSAVLTVGDYYQGMKLVDVDLDASKAIVEYKGQELSFELSAVPTQQQASSRNTKAASQQTASTNRRFNRGFQSTQQPQQPQEEELTAEEKAARLEEIRQQLQEQQMDIIRKGQPPLPVELSQESDDQLVSEGVLPPME